MPVMAYDPGQIDATLAAAVGDEPALIAELRGAFLDSAQAGLESLQRAQSQSEWEAAALRLKGLAASFGAVRLMAAADAVSHRHFGDGEALRRVRRAVEQL